MTVVRGYTCETPKELFCYSSSHLFSTIKQLVVDGSFQINKESVC